MTEGSTKNEFVKMLEELPPHSVVFRAASVTWSASAMAREVSTDSDAGRQYVSDVLRLARDFLRHPSVTGQSPSQAPIRRSFTVYGPAGFDALSVPLFDLLPLGPEGGSETPVMVSCHTCRRPVLARTTRSPDLFDELRAAEKAQLTTRRETADFERMTCPACRVVELEGTVAAGQGASERSSLEDSAAIAARRDLEAARDLLARSSRREGFWRTPDSPELKHPKAGAGR